MIAFAIRCHCDDCRGDDNELWLSRCERPEKGKVRFPALGVYDFQALSTDNRVTFESWEEADAVRGVIDRRHVLEIERIELPEGHTPGRLEGR